MHVADSRISAVVLCITTMTGTAVHSDTAVSVEVVETIAAVTGTDPLEMNPPLYEVVDTDALDMLFRRSSEARVEFEYNDHTVVIDDETVTVDDTTRGA